MSSETVQDLKPNLSCLLYDAHNARFEEREMPIIQDPHDVIIKIEYVGVCGSDVHFWHHGGIGTKVSPSNPLVMGHEASGTIHSIGAAVTTLKPNDTVSIEPGIPCVRCTHCKSGKYNLCPSMSFAASPGPGPATHGCLCRYYLAKSDFVYKLPSHVDLKQGVLVEPLAVAVHSTRLAGVRPGDTVVVFGAGPVGILLAVVAKQFGATEVVSVDVNAERLEFAAKFAGVETYMPEIGVRPEDTADAIVEKFGLGKGADVVLEASGAETCVQAGVHVVAPGGTYVQTGFGRPMVTVPLTRLGEKEVTFKGSFRYGAGDFELAVGFLREGKVDLGPMVSRTVGFKEAPEAWECVGKGEGIKTLIWVGE